MQINNSSDLYCFRLLNYEMQIIIELLQDYWQGYILNAQNSVEVTPETKQMFHKFGFVLYTPWLIVFVTNIAPRNKDQSLYTSKYSEKYIYFPPQIYKYLSFLIIVLISIILLV